MLKPEQMSPEEKIGRILCFRRFEEEDDIQFTLEMIKRGACGALQIPINDRAEELIKRFRAAADYPLLIVNDMEMGFPLSNIPRAPLATLAAANNPEYIRAFAAHTASEAKKHGYSGCWGPVVDILHTDGLGKCSLGRVAGDNPERVLKVTEEIYKTYASYNFHSTGKHYPGGKDVHLDTHIFGAVSGVTEEELLSFDLVPYFELMKKGLLPTIMVGHTTYKNIDPEYPASLSKKVIDIIRKRGFDGVIYTDSFAMMAILQKYGEKKAYSLAIMAGNDIILPNYRTPTKEVFEMVLDEYKAGFITEERLNEAVRRVMALEEYCARTPEAPVAPPTDIVEVMNNCVRDSVTALCDDGVPAAIANPDKKRLFVAIIPQGQTAEVSGEVEMKIVYNPTVIANSIKRNFPNSDVEFIHEFPSPTDNEHVLAMASSYDEVVFVTYCSFAAYMGSNGFTRRIESVINSLVMSGKVEAIVHFGNPFALEELLHVKRTLLLYNASAAIPYAFEILAGKYSAKGVYPLERELRSNCPYKI